MATWPGTLPQTPLLDGNGVTPVRNYREFSPDRGPPSRRQVSTLVQRVIAWNFMFTDSERADFLTFFHTTLLDGSAAFEAVDPFDGASAEFVFEGDYSLVMLTADCFRMTSSVRRIS
jgi:hypothetical protein